MDARDVAAALQVTELGAGTSACDFVTKVINFLDGLRRQVSGSVDPKKWLAKQGLDILIAALHKWRDNNNCDAPLSAAAERRRQAFKELDFDT